MNRGWLSLGLFGLVLSAAAQNPASFRAPMGVFFGSGAVGRAGSAVAVGDFNHDGIPDLAVLSTVSGDVSILLGRGDATFNRAVSYKTGAQPVSLVVADFNGDSKLDIATANQAANSGANSVSILLGNGDGTFQASRDFAAGNDPIVLAVADFNHDGKPDLAVVNRSSNISTVLGNGDGTFQPPVSTGAAFSPTSLVAGDFNGDGKPDVAVGGTDASTGQNHVTVLFGKGDGTFSSSTDIPLLPGANASALATGDFNRDGKPDLAVGGVYIVLNNGNGTFQAPVPTATVPSSKTLLVADFNGDGKPDIAVGSSVLLGKGDGTFQASQLGEPFNAGTAAPSTAAADLNGDGKLDLIAVDGNDEFVIVFVGKGDGTFEVATLQSLPGLPVSLASADFDRDGHVDLAALNLTNINNQISYRLSILLGNGDGTFRVGTSVALTTFASCVITADLNRDLKPDLVISNASSANSTSVSVLLGNGDGTFQTAVNYTVGTQPGCVAAADVDGDGILDLVVPNTGSGTISVLKGNGDGTFQPATSFAVVPGPVFVAVGDFNRDGKPDLAVASGAVAILLGNGNGTFQTPPRTYAVSLNKLIAVDLNGDGKLDLLGTDGSSSQVWILFGNGDGTFQPPSHLGSGVFPLLDFVATDLNGDSKLDLATPGAQEGLVSVLAGDGSGAFPSASFFHFTTPYVASQAIVAGDFNGDRLPDLAIANLEVSNISVLINNSPALVTPTSTLALSVSPATATVTRGQSVSFSIALNPLGGPFANPVFLSCSNLPSAARCAFSNNNVIPNGSMTTVTVTITPAAASAGVYSRPLGKLFSYALLFSSVMALATARKHRGWQVRLLSLLVMLFPLLLCMACGGGGGGGSTSGGGGGGGGPTPAGTYVVRVVATSGNLQTSVPMTLTVQ